MDRNDIGKAGAEADSPALLGELSSAVAHSLRNPLASIRSSAELILDADGGQVRRHARDIITQVDFLSRWVRDLLLFTQPLPTAAEPVDLAAVLGQVIDCFAPACDRAGVRVVWEREAVPAAPIAGNAPLVTQALHSIVANALEAMPRGGELRIGIGPGEDGGSLALTIADTGVGMSEKQLAQAFKPFHTTKRHGMGVGLAMARRVVERFGGAVSLSSRENQGTEVLLQFRMA